MPSEKQDKATEGLLADGKIHAAFVCSLLALLVMLEIAAELGLSSGAALMSLMILPGVMLVAVAYAGRSSRPDVFFRAGPFVGPVSGGLAAASALLPWQASLGLAGLLFISGFDALAVPLGLLSGLLLSSVLIAPFLRKSGSVTAAEFLGRRYGAVPRLIACVVTIAALVLLLAAEFGASAHLLALLTGISDAEALLAVAFLVLVLVLPGGLGSASLAATGLGLLVVLGAIVPLMFAAHAEIGTLFPFSGYGAAISAIGTHEVDLIERGLADFESLTPHVKPYLRLDALNFVAAVLVIAFATAVLPQLVLRVSAARSVPAARLSLAWAGFFLLLTMLSASALAAVVKLDLFRLVAAGTPLGDSSSFLLAASRSGAIAIHGVSLGLFEAVSGAIVSGAEGAAAIGTRLAPGLSAQWTGLAAPVQEAMIAAARTAGAAGEAALAEAFRTVVLPAAASAAGSEPNAGLSLQALTLAPGFLFAAVPVLPGMPVTAGLLFPVGALAGALSALVHLSMALAFSLVRDLAPSLTGAGAPEARQTRAARLGLIAVVLMAAAAAWSGLLSSLDLAAAAVSLIAAGLFPPLVLGIWSKRANAWGASAGMLAAIAVCLYYLFAPRLAPIAFFETWSWLSSAGDAGMEELRALGEQVRAAEGEEQSGVAADMVRLAAGGTLVPGFANWFGVLPLLAAVFALPVGFLGITLVSRLTAAPPGAVRDFVEALRVPRLPLPAAIPLPPENAVEADGETAASGPA